MNFAWNDHGTVMQQTKDAIEARLSSLNTGHGADDLAVIHLSVALNGHHVHGGREAKIWGNMHGREVVARCTGDDAGPVLNQAVDLFEREVQKIRNKSHRRRRGPGSLLE